MKNFDWPYGDDPILWFAEFLQKAGLTKMLLDTRLKALKGKSKETYRFSDITFLGGRIKIEFEFDGTEENRGAEKIN